MRYENFNAENICAVLFRLIKKWRKKKESELILDGLGSVVASASVPEFDAAVAEACRNIYIRCAQKTKYIHDFMLFIPCIDK
jgi:hypothetical protein